MSITDVWKDLEDYHCRTSKEVATEQWLIKGPEGIKYGYWSLQEFTDTTRHLRIKTLKLRSLGKDWECRTRGMREEFWRPAASDTILCLGSFLVGLLDVGLCWVLLAVKQREWIEELEQSQCLLCRSHGDEKNIFFFKPKPLDAISIRSSDYMERFSHLTKAKQELGSIHKLLHSYGMYIIWEVQLCLPTNISMQKKFGAYVLAKTSSCQRC